MTNPQTYNGDVTLNGSEQPPIDLRDPADVFVTRDSVDGDLVVRNAEYVFTHQDIGGDGGDGSGDDDSGASGGTAETTFAGDLEDGYVERVAGDVSLTDAEDVFISAGAVDGAFTAPGAENVYADDTVPEAVDWDVDTVGWQQSDSAVDPTAGVSAVGMDHEIELTKVRQDLDLYLVGHGHDVHVDGRSAQLDIHFVGYDNTVHVGAYLSADVVSDAGFDNTVDEAPFPAEDLVELSKEEAYANAGFGRRKVTYQVPAPDEDWCPNCGEVADAVIERHQEEAFFVFGFPLWTYEQSTNPACECEHCSPNAVHAELSPEERRAILD